MANSSWTARHVRRLFWSWKPPLRVFPPCNTETLQSLPLDRKLKRLFLISVAQFRPEKNHALQLSAYALARRRAATSHTEEGQSRQNPGLRNTFELVWIEKLVPDPAFGQSILNRQSTQAHSEVIVDVSGTNQAHLCCAVFVAGLYALKFSLNCPKLVQISNPPSYIWTLISCAIFGQARQCWRRD